jgi:hypothetical protein
MIATKAPGKYLPVVPVPFILFLSPFFLPALILPQFAVFQCLVSFFLCLYRSLSLLILCSTGRWLVQGEIIGSLPSGR